MKISIAGVTEIVVVAFEVVKVEHDHGERTMLAAAELSSRSQKFLHVAPVVKAGERIADGLQAESFLKIDIRDS